MLGAEKAGPQLSSTHDCRITITRTGRFMRKSRLDEFPQFWNVISRGHVIWLGLGLNANSTLIKIAELLNRSFWS